MSEIHRDRVAVVINGNAKDVTRELVDILDQIVASGDLFVSRSLEEGREIARDIVARGYQTVLTGGGDGTFSQMVTAVVRGCREQGRPLPRFGLLRLGTGNSLAWVLGASKSGDKGAKRGLALDLQKLRNDAGSRGLRLVEAEGMLSPFCGFGIDAIMLKDYGQVKSLLARGPLKRLAPGILSYAIAATTKTVPSYLIRKTPHCRVINQGAEAFRVGGKGKIVGAPVVDIASSKAAPVKTPAVAAAPARGAHAPAPSTAPSTSHGSCA